MILHDHRENDIDAKSAKDITIEGELGEMGADLLKAKLLEEIRTKAV